MGHSRHFKYLHFQSYIVVLFDEVFFCRQIVRFVNFSIEILAVKIFWGNFSDKEGRCIHSWVSRSRTSGGRKDGRSFEVFQLRADTSWTYICAICLKCFESKLVWFVRRKIVFSRGTTEKFCWMETPILLIKASNVFSFLTVTEMAFKFIKSNIKNKLLCYRAMWRKVKEGLLTLPTFKYKSGSEIKLTMSLFTGGFCN